MKKLIKISSGLALALLLAVSVYGPNVVADFPALPPIDAIGSPSVAASGTGAVYAFARGADDALWWSLRGGDNLWSDWTSLEGVLTSSPDCASPVSSMIVCAVRGIDNGMWVKTAVVTGNGVLWGEWDSQGGILDSGPSIAGVNFSDGHVELQAFVKGPAEALWTKRFNGTAWGNWIQSPGVSGFQNSPDCTWRGEGEFDCVVHGANNAVLHNDGCCLNTAGASWENLGGNFLDGPTTASRSSSTLDVVARSSNDNLLFRHYNGNAWTDWIAIDVPFNVLSSPDCVATNEDVILCAFRSDDGNIRSVDLFLN
jgi:hypothetical protein